MTDPIRLLFDHLAWADRRTLGALESAASVPVRALTLFAHVLAAEHVWLSRIRGEDPALPVWPTLDLPGCAALARANADGFATLLDSLDAEGLERMVTYRNSAGQAFESRVVEMLLQVATHGCYHRGQVALLLRDAGAEPSATDLIAFVRGVPAAKGRASTALPVSMVTGKASPAKAAVGDRPVFAYIASLPQPQRGIAESVDALAAKTLPDLERSVKWGMSYYGVGDGWCFCCGGFAGHVKLMFMNGVALTPVPPVTPVAMGKATRGVELKSADDLDEIQIAEWMKQVTAVPGVGRKKQ